MAITSQVSSQAVNATTLVCATPASVAASDLLYTIAGLDFGAGASTNGEGFTEQKDEGLTDVWAWLGYKIAAGGETACTLTHVTERGNAIVYRIPAADWHGSQAPEITAVANGTSANPDCPVIAPSWGAEAGTTFITAIIVDDSATPFPVTVWPTNYTLNQVQNATAISAAAVAAAIRIAASASENPSAHTMTVADHWRAYTIAIRGPVVAAGKPPRSNQVPQLLAH